MWIYLTASVLALVLLGNNNGYAYTYQIWLGYFYTFMTARIVNNMQLAHVCNEEFFQVQYVPLLFCFVLNIFTLLAAFSK